jgi:hypothetical protein
MYLFSFLFDSFHFIVEESPPSPAIVTRKQGLSFAASLPSFYFVNLVPPFLLFSLIGLCKKKEKK